MNKKLSLLYKEIALTSPLVEVKLRQLYWKNIKHFHSYRPKFAITTEYDINWNEVICYLKQNGVKDGTILVLHSSFESIMPSKLKPKEIISSLRNLLGDHGTLAMPVTRTYDEEPLMGEDLNVDVSDLICTYNLQSGKIFTGLLPFFLTKEKDVVISRHPLNSLAAIGYLASPMMANNIIEDNLPSCGKNSSWAFCVENDAIIVGLGIDLCHSLTATKVATDLYMEKWPIKDWYRRRVFDIIDYDFTKRISVLEPKPVWGYFYWPLLNYRNDLIKNKILTSTIAGGVVVEIVYAKKLIDFLCSRNKNGYPYYIPKKYFK